MFSFNKVISSTHKKCFQCFLHFFKLSQLVSSLCSVFYKISLEVTCLQSPRRQKHFKTLLIFGITTDIHLYALQLVKVSTLYVVIGRGLVVQESESQEDQYLFEICLVEHSVHICHQIAIFCVSRFSKPVYSFSQLEVWKLCYIWFKVTC